MKKFVYALQLLCVVLMGVCVAMAWNEVGEHTDKVCKLAQGVCPFFSWMVV